LLLAGLDFMSRLSIAIAMRSDVNRRTPKIETIKIGKSRNQ
jgi:hypothetical protein